MGMMAIVAVLERHDGIAVADSLWSRYKTCSGQQTASLGATIGGR
jgi:hypothetical protein